tara:strand:+ start:38 stop:433 length:396 start_codon:yes stop_codon:yes gene_type:complete
MSQRVNIQYTIRMEDLDEEVQRLLSQVHNVLRDLACREDMVPPTKDKALTLSTLRVIDEHRQKLADIDMRLRDITNIVNGFISYQTQEAYNVYPEQVEAAIDEHDTPLPSHGLEEALRRLSEYERADEVPS